MRRQPGLLMYPAGLGGAGRARGGEPTAMYDVDFSALTPGRISAAALTAMGYAITRSSGSATAQSSASTMANTLAAANEGRIQSLGGLAGLLIEPAATNYLIHSRALDVTNNVAFDWRNQVGTVTYSDSGVDILGASGTTARRIQVTSGSHSLYASAAVGDVAAGTYTCSLWRRTPSGTAQHQLGIGESPPGFVNDLSTASTSWERRQFTGTKGTNGFFFIPVSGGIGIGGEATIAQDVYVDLTQWEAGLFPTSPIVTNGAAVTRAIENVRSTNTAAFQAAYLQGGNRNLRMWLQFIPLAPIANVPAQTAGSVTLQPHLFMWTDPGKQVDVSIDPTTRNVLVTGNAGATLTFGTPMPTWAAGDLVDVWLEIGADLATKCKARVNGGATVNLGTLASTSVGGASGATMSFLSDDQGGGATAGRLLPGMVTRVRTYAMSPTPSWAA